jgi:uncharacterized membrane protein
MAGIGFELKKLFRGQGFLSKVRAFAYSALVSLGPFIIATIIIASLILLMNLMDVSYKQRELFIATIVYSFIFSQIIASGFKMLVTRYISDQIYSERFNRILPSLYGVLSIVVIISGIVGALFLWNSPLPVYIKMVSYILFMELVVVFVMMEYLSTVKDYMRIVKCFLSGLAIIVSLSFVFLRFTNLDTVFALLMAMDIGFLAVVSFMMGYLQKIYGNPEKRYFDFLAYLDKFPSLFFVAFCYTLGLYIHNFIFWTSDLGVRIGGTYVYAPAYDVPTFYAFLSIMPAMVIFVVSVETNFYEKYRNYYSLITGRGNFSDIENARKEMTRSLWAEIRNIMELQLFFTLVFIAAGYYILPRLGLAQFSIDIFNILALGAYMCIIMMIIMLILLYFEDRAGALFVAVSFLLSNTLFTYLTMQYSESIYGMGFFASAFFSLIIAVSELMLYLKNINYHTFCGQPIIYMQKKGFFGRLIDAFTPKNKNVNKQ